MLLIDRIDLIIQHHRKRGQKRRHTDDALGSFLHLHDHDLSVNAPLVAAACWWVVYCSACLTGAKDSVAPIQAREHRRAKTHLLASWGSRSGRAADETEAARARRHVLTLGVEGS